jgi:hypothetical protein
MPRHVRKILIPGQLLLAALRRDPGAYGVEPGQIPDDCTVQAAVMGADPDSFELTLFSPNFPPVPDGYPIPRIEPTFHKATPPGPA